jgi:hypothetical protein
MCRKVKLNHWGFPPQMLLVEPLERNCFLFRIISGIYRQLIPRDFTACYCGAIPKKDDKGLAYRLASKNYSTVTVSSKLSSAGASSSPCLDSIKASAILLVSRRTARIASSFAGII